MKLQLEFKPQDLWVGAYWRRALLERPLKGWFYRYDLWVCLLPCLPIHLTWEEQQ